MNIYDITAKNLTCHGDSPPIKEEEVKRILSNLTPRQVMRLMQAAKHAAAHGSVEAFDTAKLCDQAQKTEEINADKP
jgi:hypothetical protein